MGGMFDEALASLRHNLRGDYVSDDCMNGQGMPSAYWNVHMLTGEITNGWVDTLQAAWSGILVSLCVHVCGCEATSQGAVK